MRERSTFSPTKHLLSGLKENTHKSVCVSQSNYILKCLYVQRLITHFEQMDGSCLNVALKHTNGMQLQIKCVFSLLCLNGLNVCVFVLN